MANQADSNRIESGQAPAALRYGLPGFAAVVFLAMTIAAAFAGTADWGLAFPIGLGIGFVGLAIVWLMLRRRGVSPMRWIDDYWSRP